MHNYGYPDYEAIQDLYPPLASPWETEERQDFQTDKKCRENNIDKKNEGSPWGEETPEIQMPRPAHLSPRKPSTDVAGVEQAAERLVSTRISSPRKDGN